MKRILIYGWYGENNYGDELLLKAILNILSPYHSTIQINVMGSNPKQILKNHSGIFRASKTFYIEPRKILSTIIKDPINTVINLFENDALIVAGGGAISDWNLTSTKEMFFLINHFFSRDKPVYLLGVGAGPISNKESYSYFYSTLSKAKEITTRDEYSYSELKKIGLENVIIGKDLSYYSDIESNSCDIPKKIKNIGIVLAPVCMKTKDVYGTLVSECRKLISELVKNYNVSLIPFQYNYDCEMMKHVSNDIADLKILYDTNNIWSIEEYIHSQDLVIGMRYHSLVLSALLNKYIIPIVYHPKNWSFCEDYDLIKYSESVGNGENWRQSNISSKHIMDSINKISEDDKYWANLSMGLQKKERSSIEKNIITNIIEG